MTAARTARRKAIRLDAAHRSATTRCVPLPLTLGSQQPPANASTPFPLVQLSSNVLLPSLPPNPVPPVHHPSDPCCGQFPIEPAATAAAL